MDRSKLEIFRRSGENQRQSGFLEREFKAKGKENRLGKRA